LTRAGHLRRRSAAVPRLIGLLALVAVAAGGCSPPRGIEAALLLGDIASGGDSALYRPFTPDPVRTGVRYRVAGRDHEGDLYRPAAPAGAALVLVPGVARAGKDDPRLVGFARSLSRAGFEVLVPDLPRLRSLQVSSRDIGDIADAVRHLADRRAPGRAVGLVAISYAAGPALLAAVSPEAGPKLRFVLAIGGYYDMDGLIAYITTGHFRVRAGDPWRRGVPNEYGKWVFLLTNADLVEDAGDRDRLYAVARRKFADRAADISDLVAAMGPEGRAVHALLVNRDPNRVPALISALPTAVRRELAALDPSRHDLARLSARLILIHGRDDTIIPYSESEKLLRAAPQGRAELFLADRLMHVDLGPMGPGDTVALWRAVLSLLAERDALEAAYGAPPAPSE